MTSVIRTLSGDYETVDPCNNAMSSIRCIKRRTCFFLNLYSPWVRFVFKIYHTSNSGAAQQGGWDGGIPPLFLKKIPHGAHHGGSFMDISLCPPPPTQTHTHFENRCAGPDSPQYFVSFSVDIQK